MVQLEENVVTDLQKCKMILIERNKSIKGGWGGVKEIGSLFRACCVVEFISSPSSRPLVATNDMTIVLVMLLVVSSVSLKIFSIKWNGNLTSSSSRSQNSSQEKLFRTREDGENGKNEKNIEIFVERLQRVEFLIRNFHSSLTTRKLSHFINIFHDFCRCLYMSSSTWGWKMKMNASQESESIISCKWLWY